MSVNQLDQSARLAVAYYKGRKALNPGAKIGDQMICAWPRSRGDFSHAEMVFDYSPLQSSSLCASASMRDDGVRFKHINLNSGRWVLRHIDQATELDARRCLEWYVDHEGAPYDWLGVAGFVLPGALQMNRAVYCSESCLLAWGRGSMQLAPSQMFAAHDALLVAAA